MLVAQVFFLNYVLFYSTAALVVVGFEESSVYVREGRGRVEVCVVVYEPYQAPFRENFTVTIATEDGLAGRTSFILHIVYIAINFTSENAQMYTLPLPTTFFKCCEICEICESLQLYGSLNQLVILCKIISSLLNLFQFNPVLTEFPREWGGLHWHHSDTGTV